MSPENPYFAKPEFTVNVGRSRAEVFDMQGILADARKGGRIVLYESSNFKLPIESMNISTGYTQLPSGESGFSYTGNITFNRALPQTEKIVKTIQNEYKAKATPLGQEHGVAATRYSSAFLLQDENSSKFLMTIWAGNTIQITNNRQSDRIYEDLCIYPPSERDADQQKLFSGFLNRFVQAANLSSIIAARASGESQYQGQVFTVGKNRRRESLQHQPEIQQKQQRKERTIFNSNVQFERRDALTTLNDIGGLHSAREQLRDIAVSFKHPEIMEKWGTRRPQGVILHGEPGTGKTMLAEALINEIGAESVKIDGTDIYDKWLGDAEKNAKAVFDKLKQAKKPVVLLLDEFDSLVSTTDTPSAGGADIARNAVAGIFKQELNTLAKENPHVLVVAITNHLDKLDPTIIRSGRFDHKIAVGMPDEQGRGEIFSGIIAKSVMNSETNNHMVFGDDLDITILSQKTDEMSGADIAEIFRRLRFDKAMQEARGKTVGPIVHQDIVTAIKDFKERRKG